MDVPVHGERRRAEQLGAVHADVVALWSGLPAISRVNRVHARKGDVAAVTSGRAGLLGVHGPADRGRIAIERPALDQGKPTQIDRVVAAHPHDFLAHAAANGLRRHLQQRDELPSLRHQITQPAGGFHSGQRRDLRRQAFESVFVASQRTLDAAVGAEQIDRQWEVAAFDLLEEQRSPAERRKIRIKPDGRVTRTRRRRDRLRNGPSSDFKEC